MILTITSSLRSTVHFVIQIYHKNLITIIQSHSSSSSYCLLSVSLSLLPEGCLKHLPRNDLLIEVLESLYSPILIYQFILLFILDLLFLLFLFSVGIFNGFESVLVRFFRSLLLILVVFLLFYLLFVLCFMRIGLL